MVVSNALTNPPIVAQYVRVLPVTWHNYSSMRVDFYGCIPGEAIQQIFNNYSPKWKWLAVNISNAKYPTLAPDTEVNIVVLVYTKTVR